MKSIASIVRLLLMDIVNGIRLRSTTSANSNKAPTTKARDDNRYIPKVFNFVPDGLSDYKRKEISLNVIIRIYGHKTMVLC